MKRGRERNTVTELKSPKVISQDWLASVQQKESNRAVLDQEIAEDYKKIAAIMREGGAVEKGAIHLIRLPHGKFKIH